MKASRDSSGNVIVCLHWKVFPTPGTQLEVEEQHRKGEISSADYQRAQIFHKVCGLQAMADSCLKCQFCRRLEHTPTGNPVLSTLDGKLKTPLIDPLTIDSTTRVKARQIKL